MPKSTTPDEILGSVPEGNRPGHHPEVEQDKPTGYPPGPPRTGTFAFAFHPLFRLPALAAGVTPGTSEVVVTAEELRVRFGPWSMVVDRDDIVSVRATGPYQPWKVIGPPRLSAADRGITFGTTAHRGVCIELRHPVRGIEPLGLVRHPGITVTVEDVDGLVELLGA